MTDHQTGRQAVSHFYALTKVLQVYDPKNEVVQNTAQKMIDYIADSPLELLRVREYVFLNKERLRFEIDGYESLRFIHGRLAELQIKSLTFLPDVTRDEVVRFAAIFARDRDSFVKLFSSEGFGHIRIEYGEAEETVPEIRKSRERTMQRYFKALNVTKKLMQNLWAKQPTDSRAFRRVVFSLVDSLSEDEFGLLALAAIKNFDEYTYSHSLNVGVLSIALGQRIGLSKLRLAHLGTAGMLHDMGKVHIPKEVIDKPGALTDEEWEMMKGHTRFGVEEILKTRGADEIGLISLMVSFQHHWNMDGTGYPEREDGQEQILFSRIVRICDTYDAMTTPRAYQTVPVLPHYALRVLWARRNTYFDPILVKVFTQMLGIYPIGSCLELATGEVAVVTRQNPGCTDAPVVAIVLDRNKQKSDGDTVDLAADKERKIARAIYPEQYDINPGSYIM